VLYEESASRRMGKVSLPNLLLRFRGFRVLQSLYVREILKAHGLLSSRSPLGCPGAIGIGSSYRVHRSFSEQWNLSSHALRRHLSVFFLRLPQPPSSHVDHGPTGIVPRISFLPFSISGSGDPSFHSQVLWKRRTSVALLLRRLTPGFGYPLDELVWPPHPWRSLSTSNALGLRPSEL